MLCSPLSLFCRWSKGTACRLATANTTQPAKCVANELVWHGAFIYRFSTLVFDEKCPYIDKDSFLKVDGGSFYGTGKEEMPPKMPLPWGNLVRVSCFVHADHAGNVVTNTWHTGISVLVNNALISWFLKRQNTVECYINPVRDSTPRHGYSTRTQALTTTHLQLLPNKRA